MRAVLVVPGDNLGQVASKYLAPERNNRQPTDELLHREYGPLDDSDAAVFSHRAKSRTDFTTSTPSLEPGAPELCGRKGVGSRFSSHTRDSAGPGSEA